MTKMPDWTDSEVRSSLNPSKMLPSIRKVKQFKSFRDSPSKFGYSNIRNSSVIQRPSNPMFKETEFQMRCEKLWSKFNSGISPVLQKYNQNGFHQQHRYSNSIKLKKLSHLLYKNTCLEKKIKKEVEYEVEVTGFGVQCEISRESSNAEIKVSICRY